MPFLLWCLFWHSFCLAYLTSSRPFTNSFNIITTDIFIMSPSLWLQPRTNSTYIEHAQNFSWVSSLKLMKEHEFDGQTGRWNWVRILTQSNLGKWFNFSKYLFPYLKNHCMFLVKISDYPSKCFWSILILRLHNWQLLFLDFVLHCGYICECYINAHMPLGRLRPWLLFLFYFFIFISIYHWYKKLVSDDHYSNCTLISS